MNFEFDITLKREKRSFVVKLGSYCLEWRVVIDGDSEIGRVGI